MAKENWRPSVVAPSIKQVDPWNIISVTFLQRVNQVASLEPWPGVVPILVASLASNREMEVLATLDSLAGLMEMDEEVEEGEVSLFLTTVVGLIKNSTWMRVRVAAYAALEASVKQVAVNMARQHERDYLMQVGCLKSTRFSMPQISELKSLT